MKRFTLKQPVIHAEQCPDLGKSTLADISQFVRRASNGYAQSFKSVGGAIRFDVWRQGVKTIEVASGGCVVVQVDYPTAECPEVGTVIRLDLLECES